MTSAHGHSNGRRRSQKVSLWLYLNEEHWWKWTVLFHVSKGFCKYSDSLQKNQDAPQDCHCFAYDRIASICLRSHRKQTLTSTKCEARLDLNRGCVYHVGIAWKPRKTPEAHEAVIRNLNTNKVTFEPHRLCSGLGVPVSQEGMTLVNRAPLMYANSQLLTVWIVVSVHHYWHNGTWEGGAPWSSAGPFHQSAWMHTLTGLNLRDWSISPPPICERSPAWHSNRWIRLRV